MQTSGQSHDSDLLQYQQAFQRFKLEVEETLQLIHQTPMVQGPWAFMKALLQWLWQPEQTVPKVIQSYSHLDRILEALQFLQPSLVTLYHHAQRCADTHAMVHYAYLLSLCDEVACAVDFDSYQERCVQALEASLQFQP